MKKDKSKLVAKLAAARMRETSVQLARELPLELPEAIKHCCPDLRGEVDHLAGIAGDLLQTLQQSPRGLHPQWRAAHELKRAIGWLSGGAQWCDRGMLYLATIHLGAANANLELGSAESAKKKPERPALAAAAIRGAITSHPEATDAEIAAILDVQMGDAAPDVSYIRKVRRRLMDDAGRT